MQPDDKLLIYGRIKTVLFPHLTRVKKQNMMEGTVHPNVQQRYLI